MAMTKKQQSEFKAAIDRAETLPSDVHKCSGFVVSEGELRTGCDKCLRRTLPAADPDWVWHTAPPAALVGGRCPLLIEEMP